MTENLASYSLTRDTIFHQFFIKRPDLLRSFVAAALGVPESSVTDFLISNPEIPPRNFIESCRLDVSMKLNSKPVAVEVVAQNEGDVQEPSLLSWSRVFSSSIERGRSNPELTEVIAINIMDFKLFDCPEHKSIFALMEEDRHTRFSDHLQIIHYELPKLPKTLSSDDLELLWLAFFQAKSPKRRELIAQKGGIIMERANETFNSVIASEEFKELERLRLEASQREATLIENVDAKWKNEMARKEKELARMEKELAKLRGLVKAD